MQRQVQLKALTDRFQLLVAAVPLSLPIAIPNATERFTRGGDAGSGSIDAFQVIELPTIQVAQRQMREVEIAHLRAGVRRGLAADGLPEEGLFECEPAA